MAVRLGRLVDILVWFRIWPLQSHIPRNFQHYWTVTSLTTSIIFIFTEQSNYFLRVLVSLLVKQTHLYHLKNCEEDKKERCSEGCTIQSDNSFWWSPPSTKTKKEASSYLLLRKGTLRGYHAPDTVICSAYVTHSIFWVPPKQKQKQKNKTKQKKQPKTQILMLPFTVKKI